MAIVLVAITLIVVFWVNKRIRQAETASSLSRPALLGLRFVRYTLLTSFILIGLLTTAIMAGVGDSFVFVPTKETARWWNPDKVPFKPVDVYYDSPSGNKIHAWLVKPHLDPNAKPSCYIIYFHGNAGNLTHHYFYNQWFVQNLNAVVFAVDYSGYGTSTGKPSEKNCYADALAGLKKFMELENIAPDQIVIMGRSLGGAVAMQLAMDMQAEKTPCRALILESTFSSISDMANRVVLAGSLLTSTKMDTNSKLKEYTGNVLITHGKKDSVVPYKQSTRNFKTASAVSNRQGKLAFISHTEGHMDIPTGYAQKIKEFLSGNLEGKITLP